MACQTFVLGDVAVSWVVRDGKGVVTDAEAQPAAS